jgi:hypothetical protein
VFFFSQALTQSLITVIWLTETYILGMLAPVVFWPGRRFPIERKVWLRRTAIHIVFGVVFARTRSKISFEIGLDTNNQLPYSVLHILYGAWY